MKHWLFLLCLLNVSISSANDTHIRLSAEQIDNLNIQLGHLNPSPVVPLLTAPATVVVPAQNERLVSTTQAGLVVQLLANLGDSVKQGQALAQLNSPDLLGLQQAFLSAHNAWKLAHLAYQRDQTLLHEGVIAERRWQESQAQLHSQAAQRDAAQQLLQLAGMSAAEIKQLTLNPQLNGLITLRAPISGVVLERIATLGARLDHQAPLYRIADLSELWLEIRVPQERAHLLTSGDRLQRLDGTTIATVNLLGRFVDSSNQTVVTRARIDTPTAERYRSGQTLTVQVVQAAISPSFEVPANAIAQHNGQHVLFVKTADGFSATAVTVLGKTNTITVISGPLNGTETIALQGAAALKANWIGLGGGE